MIEGAAGMSLTCVISRWSPHDFCNCYLRYSLAQHKQARKGAPILLFGVDAIHLTFEASVVGSGFAGPLLLA